MLTVGRGAVVQDVLRACPVMPAMYTCTMPRIVVVGRGAVVEAVVYRWLADTAAHVTHVFIGCTQRFCDKVCS
jgi:hypothetical protein